MGEDGQILGVETLIGVGAICSILVTELFHISPGGLIIPGYLLVCSRHPLWLLAPVGVAFIAMESYKILSRHILLFGRRKFSAMVIIGMLVWGIAIRILANWVDLTRLPGPEWSIVAYFAPGLMASDMERQGIVKTLISAIAAVALLKAALMIFGFLVPAI